MICEYFVFLCLTKTAYIVLNSLCHVQYIPQLTVSCQMCPYWSLWTPYSFSGQEIKIKAQKSVSITLNTLTAPQTLVVRPPRIEKQANRWPYHTATLRSWTKQDQPPIQELGYTSGNIKTHICPLLGSLLTHFLWNSILLCHHNASGFQGSQLLCSSQKPQDKHSILHSPWGTRRHEL